MTHRKTSAMPIQLKYPVIAALARAAILPAVFLACSLEQAGVNPPARPQPDATLQTDRIKLPPGFAISV